MKSILLKITDEQELALKNYQEKTGAVRSSIIRMAIDQFLRGKKSSLRTTGKVGRPKKQQLTIEERRQQELKEWQEANPTKLVYLEGNRIIVKSKGGGSSSSNPLPANLCLPNEQEAI